MPLTVTVVGNRAYITGDGFAFTTSLSGSQVDITGVGRTVAVDFVDPQANIQWSGGNGVSSSSYIDGCYWYQGHMPGEINHSLKSTTAMTAKYLSTGNTYLQNVAFTDLYMFECYSNFVGGAIYKTTLSDGSASGGVTIPEGVYDAQFIAYSNTISYFFAITDTAVVIYKVDWTTETCTKVAEENGGWLPYITGSTCRAISGLNDVLVGTVELDTETQALLGVMIFDLTTDSVVNFEVVAPESPHGTGLTVPIGIAQDGNSVAFVVSQAFEGLEEGNQYCLCPIIVGNIITGIVTKTDLPLATYIAGEANDREELYIEQTAMDNVSGILYYGTFKWIVETVGADEWYLRTLTGPVFSPPGVGTQYPENWPGFLTLRYGDQGTVWHRTWNNNVDQKYTIVLNYDSTTLCTLPLSQEANDGALDDENNIFWTFDPDNDQIVGTALSGGVARDITIDFSGTTGPSAGVDGKKLFIFNGYAVAQASDGKWWYLYPTIVSPSASESPSTGESGSVSPSATPSASLSPSPSESPSVSPSSSASPSVSPSSSESPSISPSSSVSPSVSPSSSESPSVSPSGSESPSSSESPSISPSSTSSPSVSPSSSESPSISPSPSESPSSSESPSLSPSASPSPSAGGDALLLESGDKLLLE